MRIAACSSLLLLTALFSACGAGPGPAPQPEPGPTQPGPESPRNEPDAPVPGQVPPLLPSGEGEAADAQLESETAALLGPELRAESGLRLQHVRMLEFARSRLVLRLDAGSRRAPPALPGLARLAARCLVFAPMGGEKGEHLVDRLGGLGASLELDFGERFVRLIVDAPRSELAAAAKLLATALTRPTPSPEFVRWQARLLREELRADLIRVERRWEIAQCLGLALPAPQEELRSLLALRAAQVAIFRATTYRSENAILLVGTSEDADAAKQSLGTIGEQFADWKQGAFEASEPSPGVVHPLSFVVAEAEESAVVAAIRAPSPGPEGRAAAIAWELLHLDGHGGSLGASLQEAGLGRVEIRSEILELGRDRVAVLHLHVRPSELGAAREALRAAVRNLATEEIPLRDFQVARARAALQQRVRLSSPASRWRLAERLLASSAEERKASVDFDGLLPRDVAAAVRQRFGAAVLVRGPELHAPEEAHRVVKDVAGGLETRVRGGVEAVERSQEERVRGAKRRLDAARRALTDGSGRQLGIPFGLEAEVVVSASVPYRESWRVDPRTGHCERTRTVLGTKIETRLDDTGTSEKAGIESRALPPAAAEFFGTERDLLLPMLLQEDSSFSKTAEWVGVLRSRGRDLAVLAGRLRNGQEVRLSVDEENGLPRRLEFDEWQPGSAASSVLLLFRTYHEFEGRRLPRTIFRYTEGEYRSASRVRWFRAE